MGTGRANWAGKKSQSFVLCAPPAMGSQWDGRLKKSKLQIRDGSQGSSPTVYSGI